MVRDEMTSGKQKVVGYEKKKKKSKIYTMNVYRIAVVIVLKKKYVQSVVEKMRID